MPSNDDLFRRLNTWAVERAAQGVDFDELSRRGHLVAELYDIDVTPKDFSDTIAAVLENLDVFLGAGSDVTAPDFEPWFSEWRAANNVPRWDRYAKYLIEDKGWGGDVVDGLDKETSHLIDLAGNPNIEGEWRRRGLAIGEVQSGKTANYIGVLNKAIDAGYKIIIVIGGHTNDLRRQTQERIDSDLLGFDTNFASTEVAATDNSRATAAIGVGKIPTGLTRPSYLTTVLGDFSKSNKSTQGVTIGDHPVVGVVKKHAGTLQNLTGFLKHQATTGRLTAPLLVIDDESDWASVNTGTEDKVVAVNRAIRDLLAVSTRSSYLAITATPFANILIDSRIEEDLFPKDYIRALPSPSNYMGVESYHSKEAREGNPLRLQTGVEDVLQVLPYNHKRWDRIEGLPDSLKNAIYAFYLGTAARRLRDGKARPASMMVNISRFNDVQERIYEEIDEFVRSVSRTLEAEVSAGLPAESETLAAMRAVLDQVYPSLEFSWDDLREPLTAVAREIRTSLVNANTTKVIEKHVNSLSRGDRAAFLSRPVIQIGGNVLARGLTLEGLQVSYFLRRAGAADTLLQMGRWFGYRPRYEDLVRVWIDEEIDDLFEFTAEVSAELRASLAELKRLGLTPIDFGLRIRLHPEAFRITAANKSKHGEVVSGEVSIHGSSFSSGFLPAQTERREANLGAARTLLRRLTTEAPAWKESGLVWRGVPADYVREFFAKFTAADEDIYLGPAPGSRTSQMLNAMDDAVKAETWDVKFVEGESKDPVSFGEEITLRPSIRNAMSFLESGSIMLGNRRLASGSDLLKSLSQDNEERVRAAFNKHFESIGQEAPTSMPETFVAREGLDRPILLVYTVTAPQPKEKKAKLSPEQKALLAGPLIGAMVAFPRLPDDDERNFARAKATKFIANTVYQQRMLGLDGDVDDDVEEE